MVYLLLSNVLNLFVNGYIDAICEITMVVQSGLLNLIVQSSALE